MTMHKTAVSLLLILAGCTASHSPLGDYGPAGLYARSAGSEYSETDDPSLFKSDTEVLSDSAIRRILEYRLTLPDANRVAVLNLSERRLWSPWVLPRQGDPETTQGLLGVLTSSPRIKQASLLPSLLVPRHRTVGYLREAAARYQADLLLVYRVDCQTYERTRFLASSEVKASCSVESVLIDTRTGIVPFTTSVEEDFTARKQSSDANFADTVRRIEREAISKALEGVGQLLVAFLQRPVPIPP
jgi:hypothetical protein